MIAVDTYDFRARHLPVVLAGLPLLWTLAFVGRDLGPSLSWPILTTTTGIAVFMLFGRFARTKGREAEAKLMAIWDGMPATAMLRHRDDGLNQHTKNAYHLRLQGLDLGLKIPTRKEEEADPAGADITYGAVVNELRRRAKAANDKAVARENIGYGFARNIYGLRPYAIGLGILCSVVLAGLALWRAGGLPSALAPSDVFVSSVPLLYAGVFPVVVTQAFVRHHADAYAKALLETAAVLPAKKPRGKTARSSSSGK